MPATKTPHHAKKPQNFAELVKGGAGDWVIIDGRFFDPNRKAWVTRCRGCKQSFYAKRRDAKTHSPACRKRVQRRTLKQNSKLAEEMKTSHEAQLLALGF